MWKLAPCLVIGLLAVALPAADKEGKPGTPVFPSEISLVSIPVFVTDRGGKALPGLTADAFEVYEDGKRVPIVAFQSVDTTSADDQEQIRQAPAARRRFLFLFDLSFTSPSGLHRSQAAAREFLRTKLAQSDLAAVATYDTNRGVRIVANFTEDRALLGHAVETLGAPALARISDPLALAASFQSTDIQSRGQGRAEANLGQTDSILAVLQRQMRQADENLYRQGVLHLIAGLDELGNALRGVEGRKQVLYFSAGFDSQALHGETGQAARESSEALAAGRIWEVPSDSRYGDSRLRDTFGAMAKVLASADCVVHAVDVTGLGADNSLTQTTVLRDTTRNTAGRDSLQFISSETGGRLFKDTNNLNSVLDEVQAMTARFYVLGYQPASVKGPGEFHKVKVKVARKGANLSHRAGYHERLPVARQTALQRKFEAAQLVMTGAGPNDLRFSSLCLPFPEKGERQTLGMVLQVPKEQLSWKAGRPVSVQVYGYAMAPDGSVADHLAQFARIDPARADADGTARGLSFYGTFRVPPGKYTIKLLVQDGESGESGVQFLDVTVPPHDSRVGFLLPPVVMEEAGDWLGLDMDQNKDDRGPSPFHVAGKPFLPRATFQINGVNREKLVLIAWEPGRAQDPASGIEIQSSLMDAKGQAVPAGLLRIDKMNREEGGRRTYVLDYVPDKIAAGDYTLRIGVGEAGEARLESYALLRFRDEGRP